MVISSPADIACARFAFVGARASAVTGIALIWRFGTAESHLQKGQDAVPLSVQDLRSAFVGLISEAEAAWQA